MKGISRAEIHSLNHSGRILSFTIRRIHVASLGLADSSLTSRSYYQVVESRTPHRPMEVTRHAGIDPYH